MTPKKARGQPRPHHASSGGLRRLPRPPTLLSRTQEVLREAIRQGRFPGNRLPPAVELAQALGVSRETIRLAQEALQQEGLLVKYRRKGTFLQPPALQWKPAAGARRVLGYLQADYPSSHGQEAVTHVIGGLMLQGALYEAGRAGCEILARHAPFTDMDRVLDELCRSTTLRGVIFASFGEEKLVRRALAHGWPTVLLDHDLHLPRISTIREDSFQGARLAVEHLASLGHRRIAHAHWRLSEELNPWRIMGYRRGLRDARLPRRRAWELAAEITPQGAELLAERLLTIRPRPTAVVCFNNTLAQLLLERVRRRGVRVPQELSVVGGGGEAVAGLTCIQADWFAMGRAAVELLLRAIASGGQAPPEHRLIPYEIRKGKTTAPPLPRAPDPSEP